MMIPSFERLLKLTFLVLVAMLCWSLWAQTVMNIGISYDTSPERVKCAPKILEEVIRGHPKTNDLILSFNKFESSSLNIMVVHWWGDTDFKAYLVGIQELNLNLKERFDAETIEFAFPTQTLYLKQDSGAQTAAA